MDGRVRRAISTLALALCVLGCGAVSPSPRDAAELAHTTEPADGRQGECMLGWWTAGQLVADGTRGTIIRVEGGDFGDVGDTMPVLWWPKFTGRRVGNEVEILDPDGNVVATTGRRYRIQAAFPNDSPSFVVCGHVNCGGEPCISEVPERSQPAASRRRRGFAAIPRADSAVEPSTVVVPVP